MFTSRVLRRRWVLAVIFICSLIYFIANTFKQDSHVTTEDYLVRRSILRQPFEWQPSVPESHVNQTEVRCRNSVQGEKLIADEKGYVCSRSELQAGGCCDKEADSSIRYSCKSCQKNNCCMIYEYCVSCCLLPDKKPLLGRILKEAQDTADQALNSVHDHFELCLLKCRTSSQSVKHENSYRDPIAKFCFGELPPGAAS